MKFTLFALVALCTLAVCYSAAADGDFDYEEETAPAAAPAKASPKSANGKLGTLLSPRNRGAGSLTPRKSPGTAPAASAKTTSTTEAAAELTEEDYEEGADEEGKQDVVTTTSTTEAPKKIGRGGGVRPFRSNEDLLAALKRRRAQGLSSITKEPSSTQVPTEATPSKSKSQSNSRGKTNEVSKNSRNSPRFGGSRSKAPVQEEAEETKTEDVKAKPYRARG